MWIIDTSIKRPVTVIVAAFLVLLFGYLALTKMPIQMKPTMEKPIITVRTTYTAAAPQEVEEQITIPIEEKLQAVEKLAKLTSTSQEGRSSITLEFEWGVDKNVATIDILKKLSLVKNLPEEADIPIIKAITSDEERPVYWASIRGPMPANQLRQYAEDYIKPRLERIHGVGDVRVYGGQEREIRVEVDYAAMSARGISVTDIRKALQLENKNVRGGHIDEGKRRYLVRTVGLFKNPREIESVIIKQTDGGAVYIRDVAKVFDTFKEKDSLVKIDGKPSVAFGVIRKTGENTIKVTQGVEKVIEDVNRELASKKITMHEAYDESDYIWDSIRFVQSNIIYGSIFAVLILVIFLRSWRTTIVIGLTIPIAVFASLIVLHAAGRSLNTITLAGLAFAVGMIVDNVIVVLENIYRHLEMGKPKLEAARDGALEVWGAVLASTLTTLAVFLPIMFVQEEAGQLFKDIAIAVSCAVGFSMVAALTFIPMMAGKVLKPGLTEEELENRPLLKKLAFVSLGKKVHSFFVNFTIWSTGGAKRNIAVIAVVFIGFLLSLALIPQKEYLPLGNKNFIFVVMKPIVGTNNEKVQELSDIFAKRINKMEEKKMMFHVVADRFKGMGLRVKDRWKLKVGEVVEKVNSMLYDVPGFIFVRAFQTPIFQRSLGKGFELEIRGLDLKEVERLGVEIQGKLQKISGVELVRSSFDAGNPEYRITLDRERAADLGLSVSDVADVIETVVAGKKATLYKVGGKEYDITIRGRIGAFRDYHDLERILIYTPSGSAVPLSSIANVEPTTGPTAINHIEMDRSITHKITIDQDFPMERVMNDITEKIIMPYRASLPYGYSLNLSGAAADLDKTATALKGSFILALIIIYLLMSSLFESFLYPFVIMITVPLAAAGAIIGVVVTGSELNVVTMLGFIILSGIVVNNGILIIHQTIKFMESKQMTPADAIVEAVRVRIRPIFMSTITTVLGMAPLTLRGGAGSEIYSGLGAAIAGGLTMSTIFTLLLLPALYLLMIRTGEKLGLYKGKAGD